MSVAVPVHTGAKTLKGEPHNPTIAYEFTDVADVIPLTAIYSGLMSQEIVAVPVMLDVAV